MYLLYARIRKVKAIRERVLFHPGRYKKVWPEKVNTGKPAPLKVKLIELDGQTIHRVQQPSPAAQRRSRSGSLRVGAC
jgi:hypothetical protein